MKWLSVLMLFLWTGLGATVLIEEDFEDMFPPAQWDTVPVSGSDDGWVWGDGSSSGDPDSAYSGSKYARFYSYISSNGYEEDLITDTFDLTSAANCTLSFYYINEYDNTSPPGEDWVKVYYSTDSGKSWVELDSLGIKDAWTHFEYALPDSKIIMIKFRGHSDYGYTNPCIDLFRIKGQLAHNIAVKSLSLNHNVIPPKHTLTITAEIKNEGTSDESSVPVYCWIKDSSDSIVWGDTVTIGELKSDSDTVITWNYDVATEHGDYTVIVKANLSNDAWHNDDEKEDSFHCMEVHNVPWSTSFEYSEFPPCKCWKIYNFDGDDEWELSSTHAHSGTYSAYCKWDLPNNDWLILPPVVASSNKDSLIFWFRGASEYGYGDEHFSVRLNVGFSEDTSQYTIIWDTTTSNTSFVKKVIILNSVNEGDTLRIAFHYDSYDEYGIYIDDVEFRKGKVFANDIEVMSVECKPSAVEPSQPETVIAIVKNAGTNSQSNFYVDVKVVSPSGDTVYTDSVKVGHLNPNEDTTIYWYASGYSQHGDHIAYVESHLPGDECTGNDKKSDKFHVKGVIVPPYYTGFEEDTFPPCVCWEDVYGNWERYTSAPHSGNYYAHIDYNVSEGEGILVTPTINAGYNDTLIFWWKEADSKGKDIGHDSTLVEISQDNGATWTLWKILKIEHSSTWYAETLVFQNYCGSEVKVRWRYQTDKSYSAYGFNLDDIEIRAGERFEHDVGVAKIYFSPEICGKYQTDTIKIKAVNYGENDETFSLVKMVVEPSGETTYCDTTENIYLVSYHDTIIEFLYTPDTTGNHLVIARTLLTGDEFSNNDEKKDTLKVKPPDIYCSSSKIGGDGIADVGEDSVELIITLKNKGGFAYCVSCSLSESEPHAELIPPVKQNYGDMDYNDEVSKTFLFNVLDSATNGEELTFTLHIKDTTGYEKTEAINVIVGGKKWTVMVYIIGDNNLGDLGDNDVDEMESAGSTDQMNILVQIDGSSSYPYNDSSGSRTDANRYYIKYSPSANNKIDAYPEVQLGEIDMADTTEIFDFFKWCVDNYPAQHYMFVIWDHGSGWQKRAGLKGAGWDDGAGSMLGVSNGELHNLLRKMKNYIGRNIDVFGFDECLMCMLENAYEIKEFVDYFVGSEPPEPGEGWCYHFLKELKNNPDMSPKELAKKVVDAYSDYYSSSSSCNLNAWDLGHSFQRLCWDVDKLAVECLKEGGMTNSAIKNVVSNLQGLIESWSPYNHYVDIRRLANDLKAQNISEGINEACDSILKHFGYPPYQEGMPLCTTWCNSDLNGVTYGMMINCPDDGSDLSGSWEDDFDYRWLKWAKNSAWYYFIAGYSSLPDTVILLYTGNSFVDEDGDTTPEPGEEVELDIRVRNSGNANAQNVWAKIYSEDSNISVIDDSCGFGTIPGDTEVISKDRVKIKIGSKCPMNRRVVLRLEIHTTQSKAELVFNDHIIFDVGVTKGDFPPSGPVGDIAKAVKRDFLKQEPNPFGHSTLIEFGLTNKKFVSIKIYDVTGRCIKTLEEGVLPAGIYKINFNAEKLPAGIYFCRMKTDNKIFTRKMIKIK